MQNSCLIVVLVIVIYIITKMSVHILWFEKSNIKQLNAYIIIVYTGFCVIIK